MTRIVLYMIGGIVNMSIQHYKQEEYRILSLGINESSYQFSTDIYTTLSEVEIELAKIDVSLEESMDSIKGITPECDHIDYMLAACSGAICGIMDIFLIGKPGKTPVGDITDKWFENRTVDFAKMCGWEDQNYKGTSSAIRYLERKFKIPYDQRGAGDIGSWIFDLNPSNHHFKSLGHNPTMLGLFFSILDQFNNTSHFISNGELISLQEADDSFVLSGHDIPSKIFSGFVNWFGHLISDISGSAGSKGRGMGIPSPLWTWCNDVIAIKRKMNISASDFDRSVNELAVEVYLRGYDIRYQTAQAIPVFLNEIIVRTMYAIRRLVHYFSSSEAEKKSFPSIWKNCEPFSNATVKRMVTIAHGVFCLLDVGNATIAGYRTGGGIVNPFEFYLRLNIIGIGRFAISLYGETNRRHKQSNITQEILVLKRHKFILSEYLDELKRIAEDNDDQELLVFVDELKDNEAYTNAVEKSISFAEKRKVPENKIFRSKSAFDIYMRGGN